MFDANLRGLPHGLRFFAEIVCDSTYLNKEGFKSGDVILCEMLSEDNEERCVRDSASIKVYKPKSEYFTLEHNFEDEDDDSWIVFSGREDLTGFLPQEKHVLEKAKKVLEDFGLEGSDNE